MKAIDFLSQKSEIFTEYDVRLKGSKLALINPFNIEIKIPKGVSVKYDIVNKPASFQFFDGKTPITPILLKVRELDKGFLAATKKGEFVIIDLDKKSFTEAFDERYFNLAIHNDGSISFIKPNNTLRKTPYEMQSRNVKVPFSYSYLLNHLISVIDEDEKCALFDAETGMPLSDFIFEPDKFKIVDALNLRTETTDPAIYVVKIGDVNKEDTEAFNKYILLRDDGAEMQTLDNCKLLWTADFQIEKPDGTGGEYSYLALKKVNKNNEPVTQILQYDSKTTQLMRTIEIPMVADKKYQPEEKIRFLPDGRMLLVSADPSNPDYTKGAYMIKLDGNVQQLLNNDKESIDWLLSIKKGLHVGYTKGGNLGRVSINNRSHTFETSRNKFALLALQCFGVKSPENNSAVPVNENALSTSKETQQISTNQAQNKAESELLKQKNGKMPENN